MNKYEYTFEYDSKEITNILYNDTRSKKELIKNIKFFIRDSYGENYKLISIKRVYNNNMREELL